MLVLVPTYIFYLAYYRANYQCIPSDNGSYPIVSGD